MAELLPELAERCKKAFTNGKLLRRVPAGISWKKSGLNELPVIMMLMDVTTNAGQKIGTLIDLASDTNYITHEDADRLKLKGEKNHPSGSWSWQDGD